MDFTSRALLAARFKAEALFEEVVACGMVSVDARDADLHLAG